MRILAIGAHPDDIELACGGTLANHVAKHDEVHCLVMTKGEGGSAPVVTRAIEAQQAAKHLPYDSFKFGGVSAFDLSVVKQDYVEIIEQQIGVLNPDRVYAHTRHDRHQNHEVVARCSEIAARYVRQFFTFELPSTRFGDFRPNWFVDITHTMEVKEALLAFFKSQCKKSYMGAETVRGRALDWAVRSNIDASGQFYKYVEAFCVERYIDG